MLSFLPHVGKYCSIGRVWISIIVIVVVIIIIIVNKISTP